MAEDMEQKLSSALGLLSIAAWALYGLPQVYETYLMKSGEGISLQYVFVWMVGDIFNFIGCIYTEQLPTQVYLACWFILLDCIMLIQIGYYDIYLGRTYQRIVLEPWMYESEDEQEEVYGVTAAAEHGQHRGSHGPIRIEQRSLDSLSVDYGSRQYASPNASFLDNYGATRVPHSNGGSEQIAGQSATDAPVPERRTTGSMQFLGGRSLFNFLNERTGEIESARAGGTPRRYSYGPHQDTGASNESPHVSGSVRRALMLGSLVAMSQCLRHNVKDEQMMLRAPTGHSTGNRVLLSLDSGDWICAEYEGVSCYVGLLMGYFSALVYVLGRVPQVIKNSIYWDIIYIWLNCVPSSSRSYSPLQFQRKRCKIVPVAMFVLWAGILGNALLGASIMVYSLEWHELRYHFPWLAGSVGCIPLDLAIFMQHLIYDR